MIRGHIYYYKKDLLNVMCFFVSFILVSVMSGSFLSLFRMGLVLIVFVFFTDRKYFPFFRKLRIDSGAIKLILFGREVNHIELNDVHIGYLNLCKQRFIAFSTNQNINVLTKQQILALVSKHEIILYPYMNEMLEDYPTLIVE